MKILVTGASGYIGTHLIKLATVYNHQIVAASRSAPINSEEWLYFDLLSSKKLVIPEKVNTIIHLAANTEPQIGGRQEISAARSLIVAASEIGAKFIFVSSQTARIDAPTEYGRTKWLIEQEVLAADGFVVRPGQVYGGLELGLFGSLVSLTRRLPVLPAFFPSPMIQPIHVDECAEYLLHLACRNDIPPGIYSIGSPVPISFTSFLKAIEKQRVRQTKLFIPVPVGLVKFLITLLSSGSSTRLGLYKLRSLFDLKPMQTQSSLDVTGVKLRALRSGMHRSGSDRRRRIIQEGTALLTYILRSKPGLAIVRRYVRAIETLRGGTPLDVRRLLFLWPVAWALLDDPKTVAHSDSKEVAWRINIATVIAEATPQGAMRFLCVNRSNHPVITLTAISTAIILDLWWRSLRFVLQPRHLLIYKRKNS